MVEFLNFINNFINIIINFLGQAWHIVKTAMMSNNRKLQVMLILPIKYFVVYKLTDLCHVRIGTIPEYNVTTYCTLITVFLKCSPEILFGSLTHAVEILYILVNAAMVKFKSTI